MVTVHTEVEAKYEVDGAAELPALVEVLGAARARDGGPDVGDLGDGPWSEGEAARHDLTATYYDTPDLRLAVAGLTLRRRTGGEDAGWHLKVPSGDGARSEVRLPLEDGESTVPDRLRAMTHARTGGRDLVPVAQVDTHRTVRRLVDPTGRVLLELADDHVTARRLAGASEGEGEAATWREVEVELVDAPAELLAALDPVLRERGLRPAATASKLARTLGADTIDAARAAASPAATAAGERRRGAPSAADVVLAHVRAQVEQIRAQDLPVRLDAAGSVHAMRVATRRLRSTLTTFRPLLDRAVTTPVAADLKWLAGVLGHARDAEVMRERVTAAVGGESEHVAPVDRITEDVASSLDEAYAAAHGDLLAHLDSDRYRGLLGALTDLLEHPPLRKRAAKPARRVLPGLVAASDARVRSAMRAERRAGDPEEREVLLHDARKAAKRARYAGEAVTDVFGKDARRYAEAMEGVQEAVGEHLDSMNTRTRLRELAERTSDPGTAFSLGRLHAQEDVRVEGSRDDVEAAWAGARTKRLRRWLR